MEPIIPQRRVTPVPNEPGRYWVKSFTDGEPWLVDVNDLDENGQPTQTCACGITFNRTEKNRRCKHIVAALAEHQSILDGQTHDAHDRARALKWVKFYPNWPKCFGPRPIDNTHPTLPNCP